jgi:hypothetical protein
MRKEKAMQINETKWNEILAEIEAGITRCNACAPWLGDSVQRVEALKVALRALTIRNARLKIRGSAEMRTATRISSNTAEAFRRLLAPDLTPTAYEVLTYSVVTELYEAIENALLEHGEWEYDRGHYDGENGASS